MLPSGSYNRAINLCGSGTHPLQSDDNKSWRCSGELMSRDSNDSRLALNMDGMPVTFVPEDAVTNKQLQPAEQLKGGNSGLSHKKDWVTNSSNKEKRQSCYQRESSSIFLDSFSSSSVVGPSSKSQHNSNAKNGNMDSLGGSLLKFRILLLWVLWVVALLICFMCVHSSDDVIVSLYACRQLWLCVLLCVCVCVCVWCVCVCLCVCLEGGSLGFCYFCSFKFNYTTAGHKSHSEQAGGSLRENAKSKIGVKVFFFLSDLVCVQSSCFVWRMSCFRFSSCSRNPNWWRYMPRGETARRILQPRVYRKKHVVGISGLSVGVCALLWESRSERQQGRERWGEGGEWKRNEWGSREFLQLYVHL